jgi:hypothetical protein
LTSIPTSVAEYAARTGSSDPIVENTFVGYGAPLSATQVATPKPLPGTGRVFSGISRSPAVPLRHRAVIEGTLGFWYRFYNGPKGRFQFGTQYSYVVRKTWSGITSAAGVTPVPYGSPEGLDGMVFTSFRYYLP